MFHRDDLFAICRRLWPIPSKHVISLTAAVLIFIDTFVKPLSYITLGLTALALLPWLLKFVKSAKLPGGIEVELRDELTAATEKADVAGLLTSPQPGVTISPSYALIFDHDPVLAVAGLRIELERRLRELAKEAGIEARGGMGMLLRQLPPEVLPREQASVLADLAPLLNKAVHSEEFSKDAADWAMEVGPQLLASLDFRIAQFQSLKLPREHP